MCLSFEFEISSPALACNSKSNLETITLTIFNGGVRAKKAEKERSGANLREIIHISTEQNQFEIRARAKKNVFHLHSVNWIGLAGINTPPAARYYPTDASDQFHFIPHWVNKAEQADTEWHGEHLRMPPPLTLAQLSPPKRGKWKRKLNCKFESPSVGLLVSMSNTRMKYGLRVDSTAVHDGHTLKRTQTQTLKTMDPHHLAVGHCSVYISHSS